MSLLTGLSGTLPGMIDTTLLHYRIVGLIGTGGMGEVYAAEDTKLQRRVALKLLPSDMAADPERLQRFQREARAVAALNHPNVVTIYSVEEANGVHFLTMELVEGKTLAEVIPRGGLPPEQFFKLAVALVDAVAAAHQHGIIHRDLKPANVMLGSDGRLKVLDFGLAKLKRELSAAAEATALTTEAITGRYGIIGTAAYMSPEQAEGRPVDHRSDIFSLGVVLYEMASGTRPFRGDTAVSIISSIIKDSPPPLSDLNRSISPDLDRIITRALAKDPARRYQSALDLRNDLEQAQQRGGSRRRLARTVQELVGRRWVRGLILAVALAAAVTVAALYPSLWRSRPGRGSPPAPPQATFHQLSTRPGVEQYPSLSPDGKWVVYAGQESGNLDIYLLSTSGQNPINLTSDSPADDDEPAFSPDGERIAFRSSREGGGIFVMGRTGEAARRVTRAGFNPAWSPDGTQIAFTTEDVQLTPLNWEGRSELRVVALSTGAERRLAVDDAVQASWSPHGHRIAYVVRVASPREMDIATIPAGGGEPVSVTRDQATDWGPVWSPDGKYLYFASDRGGSMNLWRVPIDEVSGKKLGDPEAITTPATFLAHPAVSGDGRQIAYSSVLQTQNIQRLSLDPATSSVKGEPVWLTSGSRLWSSPDPSQDGQWVVFYSRDKPEGDLYIVRADGTGLRQLTSDPAQDRVPRWSPDGKWIACFSNRSGRIQVWKIRADGSEMQQVTDLVDATVPVWSADGTRMATSTGFDSVGTTYVFDPNRLWKVQTPQALPRPEQALQPFIVNSWSPDGARLAGQIDFAAGGKGIVIYSFTSGRYERLTDFGEWPVWLGDSRRLLFVARMRELWVLDSRSGQARKIFSATRDVLGPPRLTRDGREAYCSRRVTEADIWLLTLGPS
jgi:eukaryotic-like serine/threonine-protein kinase